MLRRILITFFGLLVILQIMKNSFISSGWPATLIMAFVLTFVNATLRPLMHIFSLPFTLITLGLFAFVVNAICFQLAAWLAGPGFSINGFGAALWGSLLLSLVTTLVDRITRDKHRS